MAGRKNFSKLIAFISSCLFAFSFAFPEQTSSPWNNLPQKKTLDNGLAMIYQKDDSSAMTVLRILIKGGKGAEHRGRQGLAYLTTRLTLEIPDSGKIQDLMSQSSHLSVTCKGDYSLIHLECLSENLEEFLKIVSKVILDPLFSGLRIDFIKKHMLHQRKLEEDDAINLGHNSHLKAFFADEGYGGSVFGDEESLKAIKNKDISSFYENYFNAANMLISVSSDLDEEKVIGAIQKYFKELPSGKETELHPKSASTPEERKLFIEKDAKQSLISIAFPLPKISSKNFVLGFMVENLLGKGVGSKLWVLRSKEKLAYTVNSQATQMKEGGILEAYLETDNEKKDLALESLKRLLRELFENGITEEELQMTKIYSKGDFLRANEIKTTRTANLAILEALGLGYEFLSKLFQEIDTVSLEEINAYIKEILNPEKSVEVIVGRKE